MSDDATATAEVRRGGEGVAIMTRVNIIFHSVSGHTYKLAEALAEGVSAISGCQPRLLRIAEPAGGAPITMPGLDKKHYDFSHVPEATIENLLDCDGLAIGTPVYWGSMSYATKYFLDSAAKLWAIRSVDQPVRAPDLAGKPATIFTGGASGLTHDPAILGLWTVLGSFGMTIVTLGNGVPQVSDPSRLDGGSPLGAGTFSRRAGKHPSDMEAAIARAQGRALGAQTRAWAARPVD
jgi:NAD(P)H dehydrogenase (quinone)